MTQDQTPGFIASAARPLSLLAACPAYAPTPLHDRADLAAGTGIARLWVKDETARMGLGSFKALGGAFAVAQIILDRAGATDPRDPAAVAMAKGLTFVTASAGNHGLSVAAGARVFGAQAAIVLSAAVLEAFADRIRAKGAKVIRVQGSYEDSVAEAARLGAERAEQGWIHLADGSWPGYTAAPALVMEGYSVLAEECRAALEQGGEWPDHIVLQAGVGGLAAAMAAHVRANWPVQPRITVVEPAAAPCLKRSVAAGTLTRAEGPVSNMGRLDCKDASLLAFECLRTAADDFVTVSDAEAVDAATRLTEAGLATTPSGAAPFAALGKLGLPASARVLLVVSEGPEQG